jgi:hypothetical protein
MLHVGDLIKCECGESTIQYGRCIGCGSIRPSSKEKLEDIKRLHLELAESIMKLEEVLDLERYVKRDNIEVVDRCTAAANLS